jgi:hypothetical protein
MLHTHQRLPQLILPDNRRCRSLQRCERAAVGDPWTVCVHLRCMFVSVFILIIVAHCLFCSFITPSTPCPVAAVVTVAVLIVGQLGCYKQNTSEQNLRKQLVEDMR